MADEEKDAAIYIRLTGTLKKRAEAVAKKDDRSVSSLVRRLLEEACTKHEQRTSA